MRLFGIPSTLVGIALAIVFFKLYGMVTRPDVPRPIAVVVNQFAPGVAIGAKVSDARYSVAAMTYVPHLGFVGVPGNYGPNLPNGPLINFSQVRLLLDEHDRRAINPNPAKTRIDAVEVVTADGGAEAELMTTFTMLFRRPPRDGCVRMSEESRVRQVHIWTTPNERGGLAVISDFGITREALTSGIPTMTSVIAFTGKFDGGRTLRANYTDASCSLVLSQ